MLSGLQPQNLKYLCEYKECMLNSDFMSFNLNICVFLLVFWENFIFTSPHKVVSDPVSRIKYGELAGASLGKHPIDSTTKFPFKLSYHPLNVWQKILKRGMKGVKRRSRNGSEKKKQFKYILFLPWRTRHVWRNWLSCVHNWKSIKPRSGIMLRNNLFTVE